MNSVILSYEYRLRENATLEKIFKYFASQVHNSREMMTPLDMARALTPGVAPSLSAKPINVPLFELEEEELQRRLAEQEEGTAKIPPFFKFGEEDLGLISFGRFLVFLTLMAIPTKEVDLAYHMASGRSFNTPELAKSDEMTADNFDFIMQRNIRVRGQGYDPSRHSKHSIVRHLFGQNLDGSMSLDEFRALHAALKKETLLLEHWLLSDAVDQESGSRRMSVSAFARAVAALLPSDYRPRYQRRAIDVSSRSPPSARDGETSDDVFLSIDDYSAWKEVLKQIDAMEQAVFRFSKHDGHFSRTNIKRSAKACADVELSDDVVWVLFELFDVNDDGQLHHDEFVKLLRPHSFPAKKISSAETNGLGLLKLAACLNECGADWLDGTL